MTAPASAAPIQRGAAERRPLRVAALIDVYDVAGSGRQLVALAGALSDQDVEMLIVMFHRQGRPFPPFAEYATRAGVRLEVIPERGAFDLGLLSRVRGLLATWGADVVETHSYKTTVLMYLLRRFGRVRIPWAAFFHGATAENLKVRFYTWLDNRLLGSADRVIVMSKRHVQEFAHLGARVRVLHNAVVPLPSSTASAPALPAAVGEARARGEPILGVVGRLSPEKGVDVFLHAFADLARRGVRCSAVIAGDGPEREALHALAARLGIAPQVHFLGLVTDVQSLYGELDLLVIPSRSEGLPNVLLEALRADLPAVSTRVGAVPEVLDGTRAGLLVEPNDPAGLAAGIEAGLHLKQDPASRTSRAEVAKRFSLEHRALEHARLYDEIRAESGSHAPFAPAAPRAPGARA
jgi:glycosyltransferase involved in cell wall biosynthesis